MLSCIMIAGCISCSVSAQKKVNLSVDAFEEGIKKDSIQLLDVRTPQEFKTGYIKGAILADWIDDDDFRAKAAGLDKEKPVYVYCRSGGRSGDAAQWLTENGFKNVFNLEGGMTAWKKNEKAVVMP